MTEEKTECVKIFSIGNVLTMSRLALLPERDEAKYMGVWHVAFTVPQVIAPLLGLALAYAFNIRIGGGFGYRVAMGLALVYFIMGTIMIRPIRERIIPGAKGRKS